MEKVQWRELRRGSEVLRRLPVVLEYDGVNVGVILSIEYYNKLVKGYKQNDAKLSLYNPPTNKAGDRVLVRQGKRLVEAIVPELDGDGNQLPIQS